MVQEEIRRVTESIAAGARRRQQLAGQVHQSWTPGDERLWSCGQVAGRSETPEPFVRTGLGAEQLEPDDMLACEHAASLHFGQELAVSRREGEGLTNHADPRGWLVAVEIPRRP